MYTFTKLHDRRIPNVGVRVRVGPVKFKLKAMLRSVRPSVCLSRFLILSRSLGGGMRLSPFQTLPISRQILRRFGDPVSDSALS